MKITLIWPNTPENSSSLYPPLGLGYIGAMLRRHGYAPQAYDLTFPGTEEKIPADSDIYGFSVTTPIARNALRLAENLRRINPRAKIVFGGAHVTLAPEDIVRNAAVDAICVGEGEYTFLELVRHIEKGLPLEDIPGLAFRQKDGQMLFTSPRPPLPKIDELPMPALDMFPLSDYFSRTGIRQLSMISTRGCPRHCTFCQPMLRKIFGSALRARSARSIVDEMEFVLKTHHVDMLMMVDDNFTWQPATVEQVCRGIRERGLDLLWRCAGRVDVPLPTLALMKQAGCVGICFGVESGSQKILDSIRKGITLEQIRSAFAYCHEIGLLTHAFIMVGNVGEDASTVQATIDLLREIRPFNMNVSIATPYPGTQLHEYAREHGLLIEEDWAKYNHITEESAGIRLENMTREDVSAAKKRLEGFFRDFAPSYRRRQLLRSLDLNTLGRLTRMALKDPGVFLRLFNLQRKVMRSTGFSFFK